jgi:hypothetical protein
MSISLSFAMYFTQNHHKPGYIWVFLFPSLGISRKPIIHPVTYEFFSFLRYVSPSKQAWKVLSQSHPQSIISCVNVYQLTESRGDIEGIFVIFLV